VPNSDRCAEDLRVFIKQAKFGLAWRRRYIGNSSIKSDINLHPSDLGLKQDDRACSATAKKRQARQRLPFLRMS
jgi:hypothetical protein